MPQDNKIIEGESWSLMKEGVLFTLWEDVFGTGVCVALEGKGKQRTLLER